jgi:hypothetical protein
MMRPRTLGKIVVAVIMVMLLITAFIYALESPDPDKAYKSYRAITLAIMALSFAICYRYFED